MQSKIDTTTYKEGGLTITVKSHGTPSDEAMNNFNRIFHDILETNEKSVHMQNASA